MCSGRDEAQRRSRGHSRRCFTFVSLITLQPATVHEQLRALSCVYHLALRAHLPQMQGLGVSAFAACLARQPWRSFPPLSARC